MFNLDLDLSTACALLTLGVGVIVYFVQKSKELSEFFLKCVSLLHSKEEADQIAGAVLLRTFLSKRKYNEKVLQLISSFIFGVPNSGFQKILADGLSMCKRAKGHDFQSCNLYNALIKPKSYIRYELTGFRFWKLFRLNFSGSDFFDANLTQLNAKSVKLKGAIFYRTILCNSTFTNCILKNADFREADMNGTTFKDCNLKGAWFKGAKRINNAFVVSNDNDSKDPVPLIYYLDEDARFSPVPDKTKIRYQPKDGKKTIFVSRLGQMNSQQELHYNNIIKYITDTYKANIVYLDRSAYRKYGQLSMIQDKMADCSGVLVFAFSYLTISKGTIHEELESPERVEINKECSYSSSWLQIETAFANVMRLPTLVVLENNVQDDGIWDDLIVKYNPRISKVRYKGTIEGDHTFKTAIANWYDSVLIQ